MTLPEDDKITGPNKKITKDVDGCPRHPGYSVTRALEMTGPKADERGGHRYTGREVHQTRGPHQTLREPDCGKEKHQPSNQKVTYKTSSRKPAIAVREKCGTKDGG